MRIVQALRDKGPMASVSFDYEPIVDMRDLEKRFGASTASNPVPAAKDQVSAIA